MAVSSPSGDVHGAEECAAVCAALLPETARVERPACSSPDHAPDLLARLSGTGTRRILLLGHVDTVIAHDAPQAGRARRRSSARLGHDRHEGRRRARAGGAARARRPQRRLRGGRAPARVRRGVAHGAVRPRRAVRRLGRMPVLRGGGADRGRGRGRGRPAQGGGNDHRQRARPRGALRLRARPRPQRAAGARRRRAGGGRLPRARRPRPPDRGADDPALGRRVQRRPGPRRAHVRPARRQRRRDHRRARRDPARRGRRHALSPS